MAAVPTLSSHRHRQPGIALHPGLSTHKHMHSFTDKAINLPSLNVASTQTQTCNTCVHIHVYIDTHTHCICICSYATANTPTYTHPINPYTQKPRVTTSLSVWKPKNYPKPLSVFILPFLTRNYPHHLPCSHLPSNLG